MTGCSFEALDAGHYRVSGELGFATVPTIWEQSRARLDDGDSAEIDLGGVTNVDSAGLALLIEWIRLARSRDKRLVFLRVPEKLTALARISELDGFFDGVQPKA
jgi:phospholipid transport system transporter-binding protein